MHFSAKTLRRFMGFWPPYLGAGVRVVEFADDGSRVVVKHKLTKLNQNAVGTVFGGTIMSMTDPFYMLASMARLGKDYRVWDVAGEVQFLKPGTGTVTAVMEIPDETYELIKEKTADGQKYLHWFATDVTNENGEIVAKVRRQVYYRRRQEA
ncbi:DUF4442 domain-containing protein [Corynebacterium liangguodongii]|uniref:Tetrameric acyl-CoA thioesterase n=1 Tax=Corynebacterium liangguodongii TaxID=2079535 RepID=A0A2S0WBV6_9CORY|nr:DUF4442 domain-containing protein [Corynebacterium liangguodongii]AWB83240.1 tetrameric acyl-CoA thioesterase [Corynebacterium liangguodongii]PWB98662.1 DUF4442 domain-containing protein [Corynebacterium liangguodongii]